MYIAYYTIFIVQYAGTIVGGKMYIYLLQVPDVTNEEKREHEIMLNSSGTSDLDLLKTKKLPQQMTSEHLLWQLF